MRLLSPLRWLTAALLCLLAIYCILGVLQAISLFQGERALWNVNLWASGTLVAAVLAYTTAPSQRTTSWPLPVARVVCWLHFSLVGLSLWAVIAHLVAVDGCLDRGGSYNYVEGACSSEKASQFIPLYRTHGFPLVATGVFLMLGLSSLRRLRVVKSRGQSAA